MRSPAEKVIKKAEAELEKRTRSARLAEKKRSVIGNIPTAIQKIPSKTDVILSDYAEGMDVIVKHASHAEAGVGKKDVLSIQARLKNDEGQSTTVFPIYRVSVKVPSSDTMFPLAPNFEIDVADLDSKTGFTPIALVDKDEITYSRSGWDYGTDSKLSPEQVDAVKNGGLYVDPHAPDMIAEVHGILDLALANLEQTKAQTDKAVGQTALRRAHVG